MTQQLQELLARSRKALAWYIEEDDVIEAMPGNEYWVNGKRDAESIIADIDAALRTKEFAWECNECGSQEYTMSVSEDDVNMLGCGNCGACEWHKAEKNDES